jgi:hypothetical protein
VRLLFKRLLGRFGIPAALVERSTIGNERLILAGDRASMIWREGFTPKEEPTAIIIDDAPPGRILYGI